MSRWGDEGPPPEAYSRVSDAARFLPLHDAALQLIAELERDYQVDLHESVSPEELPSGVQLSRPSIEVAPSSRQAASLRFLFTTFPGVLVRFGAFSTDAFPGCGCDACDEGLADEVARLAGLAYSIVRGTFRERVRVTLTGKAWLEWEITEGKSHRRGRGEIPRTPDLPRRGRSKVFEWKPWPRRV